MTVLNLNNADKLYYGATEVQKLYKGSDLLYPKSFNLLDLQPALWLDANDSSTITLVSGAVSEWRDKSGNNRHATQATAENRPLLVANGLNGTDVIRFDGVNDQLITFYTLANTHSVFYVATRGIQTSTGSALRPVIESGGANLISYGTLRENFQIVDFAIGSTRISTVTDSWITNTSKIVSATYSGTVLSGWVNGSSYGIVNHSISDFNTINIGGSINSSMSERRFGGDISQVIIFSRVLTQAEREQIEGYLAWSTGLQGNLPSNHPYKNIAP